MKAEYINFSDLLPDIKHGDKREALKRISKKYNELLTPSLISDVINYGMFKHKHAQKIYDTMLEIINERKNK